MSLSHRLVQSHSHLEKYEVHDGDRSNAGAFLRSTITGCAAVRPVPDGLSVDELKDYVLAHFPDTPSVTAGDLR